MSVSPKTVLVVHGGELARDVSEQVKDLKSSSSTEVTLRCASERPKALLDVDSGVVLCFVVQTIENEAPTEEGGALVRFFKRKTHGADLLSGRRFAVLGLGDSNLLLDRQTTGAKDCNQVALALDARLEALGGTRVCPVGLADERTGLTAVEPWIKDVFWKSV